ncbi:MAG TPA: MqnA/MqnD/SBP family protein, partial [Vampirovibrionales bacterium]
ISTKNFCMPSVLFFSKSPISELKDASAINLSKTSRTSNQLLKVILKQQGKCNLNYQYVEQSSELLIKEKVENLLIIGDEALIANKLHREGKLPNYEMYDLAECWAKEILKSNFVFAVFVARKDLSNIHKQRLQKVQEAIKANIKNNLQCLENLFFLHSEGTDFAFDLPDKHHQQHGLPVSLLKGLTIEDKTDYLEQFVYTLNKERLDTLQHFEEFSFCRK